MTGQLLDNIAEQDNIAQAVVNHEDYETFGIAEAFEPSDPMVMASRRGALPPMGTGCPGGTCLLETMVSVAWARGLVYLALTPTRQGLPVTSAVSQPHH